MKRQHILIVLLLATLPSTAFAQRVEPSPGAVASEADHVGPLATDAVPAALQSGRLYAQAAAPSPYYGQPMYAQPGYAPPPPRPRRMVVPYVGGRLPPGATIERQRRTGLLIPGAILFALSYGGMVVHALTCRTSLSTGSCLTANTGWLYVPIVGPFVAIGGSTNSVDSLALGILGVLETVGAAGLIAGMLFPRRVVVFQGYGREDGARPRNGTQWSLLPAAGSALAGLTLSVTHY